MKGNLMKRLLTLCLALVCCAGFALSQDDAKTLSEAEAVLANAAAPYTPEQFHALAMREILTGDDPATFAVMQERIAKAASQVAFKNDDERAERVRGVTISASLWRYSGRFVEEGYAYAKSAGVSDPYFALHAQKLGMSEADELPENRARDMAERLHAQKAVTDRELALILASVSESALKGAKESGALRRNIYKEILIALMRK